MGTVLNKDTKGIKVAVKAKHVTRKATERAIRKEDNFFTTVVIKNPKQLYDILDTADLYAVDDTGKYYKLTEENALEAFEALNGGQALDTQKFKAIEDVAKTLGHCNATSLLKANPSAQEAKKFGEVTVENGVVHGQLCYIADNVAESNTYKKGYFLAIGYDDVVANASGITEPKIVVNDKTATLIAGNNVVGLGEEYPKVVKVTGKVTIDGNAVEVSENVTLKVELLPKTVDERFKPFEEVLIYPVEKKTESDAVAVAPTPVAPGAAASSSALEEAAGSTTGRRGKKDQREGSAVQPPSGSEPGAAGDGLASGVRASEDTL